MGEGEVVGVAGAELGEVVRAGQGLRCLRSWERQGLSWVRSWESPAGSASAILALVTAILFVPLWQVRPPLERESPSRRCVPLSSPSRTCVPLSQVRPPLAAVSPLARASSSRTCVPLSQVCPPLRRSDPLLAYVTAILLYPPLAGASPSSQQRPPLWLGRRPFGPSYAIRTLVHSDPRPSSIRTLVAARNNVPLWQLRARGRRDLSNPKP